MKKRNDLLGRSQLSKFLPQIKLKLNCINRQNHFWLAYWEKGSEKVVLDAQLQNLKKDPDF